MRYDSNKSNVSEALQRHLSPARGIDGPLLDLELRRNRDHLNNVGKPPALTFEDSHPARVLNLWRVLRYTLVCYGYAESHDPLSFTVSEPKLQRFETPTKPKPPSQRLPSSAVPPRSSHLLTLSAATRPGGTYLFPVCPLNTPLDGPIPPADPRHFTAQIYAEAAEALRMADDNPFDTHSGLAGLVWGHTGGTYDDFLRRMFLYSPTLDEILDFEHRFLTDLSHTLIASSQDELRESVHRLFASTPYEAFAIAQTVKRWATALRPIDQTEERVALIRALEHARESAVASGDYKAVIQAANTHAKMAGLYESQAEQSQTDQMRKFEEFRKQRAAEIEAAGQDDSTLIAPIQARLSQPSPYKIVD